MTPATRARRLDNEWQAVCRLAALNPNALILLERRSGTVPEVFSFQLRQTEGLRIPPPANATASTHACELRFPRFYPAVPLEAYLHEPVFHPNIDPVNGFLCLWERTSPGDTATDAICRVQAMVVWKMFNLEGIHVMQPDAATWFLQQTNRALPLPHTPVVDPAGSLVDIAQPTTGRAQGRRRLSALG
jgi:hypothetical protein